MNGRKPVHTCRAPWACTNPASESDSASGRWIGDILVCRACYEYVWEHTPVMFPLREAIKRLPGPHRALLAIDILCQRLGCERRLRRGQYRRRIGLNHVCRPCYQTAWAIAKDKGISIEEAFNQLSPKLAAIA